MKKRHSYTVPSIVLAILVGCEESTMGAIPTKEYFRLNPYSVSVLVTCGYIISFKIKKLLAKNRGQINKSKFYLRLQRGIQHQTKLKPLLNFHHRYLLIYYLFLQ